MFPRQEAGRRNGKDVESGRKTFRFLVLVIAVEAVAAALTVKVELDIFPNILRLPLLVILALALICPSANILNLSVPAVKNCSSSLSAPADVSACIFVS